MRPDLTGALADHVLESASVAGDQDLWLEAAGWAVHARSATSDGRDAASEALEALPRWGASAITGPAASRLRIELAMVAAGAGQVECARELLAAVPDRHRDPELRADLMCALARCAVEDSPQQVAAALRDAERAWAEVEGPDGEVGAASVSLISAVVQRRGRRPDAAVDHAADGLARLGRGRGPGPSGTPSGHLAAALAAEWISALLDAGRADEARDGCVPLMPRLTEPTRPSRQLALLRLTVARAVASGDATESTAQLLEQAAKDAAGSDVPDLESVCRAALGALYETAGQLDTALEALRLGVVAERRDRSRMARFRTALADLLPGVMAGDGSRPAAAEPDTGRSGRRATAGPAAEERAGSGRDRIGETGEPATGGGGRRRREDRTAASWTPDPAPSSLEDPIAEPPADPRRSRVADPDDAAGARSRRAEERRGDERHDPGRTGEDVAAAWESVPWGGAAGDSPIGDLLIRSRHPGEPADDAPRNGSTNGRSRDSHPDTSRHGAGAVNGWAAESRPSAPGEGPETASRRASGYARPDERTGSASGSRAAETSADADLWSTVDRADTSRRGVRHSDAAGTDPEGPGTWATGWSGGGKQDRERPVEYPGESGERAEAENGHRSGRSAGRDTPAAGTNGRSSNGRAHRGDDPWATGQWSVHSAGRHEGDREADNHRDDRRDDHRDRHRGENHVGPPAPSAEVSSLNKAITDPEGWLQAALADLDRVLGSTTLSGAASSPASTPTSSPGPAHEPADRGRCAVVIDIARDGRRFAGRRAGAIVRAVAGRLADRVPEGARLHLGESDALSIAMPGWDRSSATEWMYRTLPDLLADFEVDEDLPAAQLRAAVHDDAGPVGAQILQSLHHGPGRNGSPEAAASQWDERGRGERRSGRRRAADEIRDTSEDGSEDGLRGWPWAGADRGPDAWDDIKPADERGAGWEGPYGPASSRAAGRSNGHGAAGRHDASTRSSSAGGAQERAGADRRRRGAAGERSSGDDEDDRHNRADGHRDDRRLDDGHRDGRRPEVRRPDDRRSDDGRSEGQRPEVRRPADRRTGDRRSEGRIVEERRREHRTAGRGDGDRGAGSSAAETTNGGSGGNGSAGPAQRERTATESTEGLGLADLLAGALAAYRGI